MEDLILESTSKNFQSLADRITDEFYENNRDLLGKVIEVAQSEELNPEEIRRLVEKTNTYAVVKLLKNSKDKKATLPLVDHKAVLDATHPEEREEEAGSQVKTAFEIPETRKDRRLEKVAFPTLEEQKEERVKILPQIFSTEKELNKIASDKTRLENAIQDNVDYIVSEFYKWNSPDFSKFASEAYTLKGDASKPVLAKMAEYLSVDVDYDTLPYVDDSKDILVKFAQIIDGIEKLSTLEVKKQDCQDKLNELWEQAKANGY